MSWLSSLWRRQDKRRLEVDIKLAATSYDNLDRRLRWMTADPTGESGPSAELVDSLKTKRDALLDDAREALEAGDVDGGWKFLHQLEEEMVEVLDPIELEVRLTSAIQEGKEKLSGWRKTAVAELDERYRGIRCIGGRKAESADRDGIPEGEATPEESAGSNASASGNGRAATPRQLQRILRGVLVHLHARHDNYYLKLQLLRRQLRIVSVVVILTVALVLFLNWIHFFDALGKPSLQHHLWLAILSGLVGGSLSVAYSAVRSDLTRRIPEVRALFMVTLVRPLVGAAIALPLLIFVESGLLNIQQDQKVWVLLALCFVGGFMERWFLQVVESVGKRTGGEQSAAGRT